MTDCRRCGVELIAGQNWYLSHQKGGSRICKRCYGEYLKLRYHKDSGKKAQYIRKWYNTNKEAVALQNALRRQRMKSIIISHYSHGQMKCGLCPITDIRILTVDHINGGGTRHVKEVLSVGFYNWLIKNGFPPGFQILCMNCQWIKRYENNEFRRLVDVPITK